MRKHSLQLLTLALVGVVSVHAGNLRAQAVARNPSTPLLVTRYNLKPDHVSEWLQLEREQVLPALKKAGVGHETVYETVLGEAPEYTVVRTFAGFEEFDGPDPLVGALGAAGAARLEERLAACTQSIHRSLENRREEFFLDPGTAQVQYASKYRAMPGKSQAYMEFFRTEMMPVMRKAKENGTFAGLDFTVSGHGGEWGLITLNMYYTTFAPLDGEPPVAKTLGPEGTRALLAKGTGLITPLEWIVRKRLPELTY
jgi:hypothetical protein